MKIQKHFYRALLYRIWLPSIDADLSRNYEVTRVIFSAMSAVLFLIPVALCVHKMLIKYPICQLCKLKKFDNHL